MNTIANFSQSRLSRLFSQSLLVGAMSLTGVVTGVIPSISGQSLGLTFSTTAIAQEVSNEEIGNYARAVLAMEPRRQEAYNEIKGITGNVPPVVCNETKKINTLPGEIRGIAVNYCEQAKKIIENNGLTVPKFNSITLSQQADPSLKQRIQAELIRLQSGQ
jgi:hypothetical protein